MKIVHTQNIDFFIDFITIIHYENQTMATIPILCGNMTPLERKKQDILNKKIKFVILGELMDHHFLLSCMNENIIDKETFLNMNIENLEQLSNATQYALFFKALEVYQDIKVIPKTFIRKYFSEIVKYIVSSTCIFQKCLCFNSKQVSEYNNTKIYCDDVSSQIHICDTNPNSTLGGLKTKNNTVQQFAFALLYGAYPYYNFKCEENEKKHNENEYDAPIILSLSQSEILSLTKYINSTACIDKNKYLPLLKINDGNIFKFSSNEHTIYSLLMNVVLHELNNKYILPHDVKNDPLYAKYILDSKQQNNNYVSEKAICNFIQTNTSYNNKLHIFVKNDDIVFKYFKFSELPDVFYFDRCQNDKNYVDYLINTKNFNRLEVFSNRLDLLSDIPINCYAYDILTRQGKQLFIGLVDKNKYTFTLETIKFLLLIEINSQNSFSELFRKLYDHCKISMHELYSIIEKINDNFLTKYLIINDYFNNFCTYDINTDFGTNFTKMYVASGEIHNNTNLIKILKVSQMDADLYDLCTEHKVFTEESINRSTVGGSDYASPIVKCKICCENIQDQYVIVPCGHTGVCPTCIGHIIEQRDVCPICRHEIMMHIKVYS